MIEVEDDVCRWNARRWRLTADTSGARCLPCDDPADLALPVSVLGAAYLGGRPLAALRAAGAVRESRAGPCGSCPPRCRGIPPPGAARSSDHVF